MLESIADTWILAPRENRGRFVYAIGDNIKIVKAIIGEKYFRGCVKRMDGILDGKKKFKMGVVS